MVSFLGWILIGMGIGIVVLPIGMSLYILIRDTLERRRIKRMIKKGEFLQPIDEKDFDSTKWDKDIDLEKNKSQLKVLDETIFKHTNEENIQRRKMKGGKND
jgi:hypothetical protein